MPRKKVAPDDRVRAVRACRPCRQRKKKCNGINPCSNCLKRGIASECDLEETSSAPLPSNRKPSASSRSIHEPIVPSSVGGPSPEGAASSIAPASGDSGSPEVSVRTNPRMLSSARGERLFIGEHASLSFLQLMRDIVQTSIGTSAFSSEPQRNFMLEADLEEHEELDENFFSDGRIEACVDAYLLATNGLIDLFDREEITSILQTVTGTNSSYDSSLTALTYLILAIGAQAVTDENYARKEHVLFAQGRKAAFETFLEDPGIGTARLFVLCAFYMFGACRRNAAYMYLGVASRAAHCIGLHNYRTYDALRPEEVKKRSRLWKSLFSLDVIACSILGRPPASRASSQITYIADVVDSQSLWASSSIYKLARIVEDISTSLSGRKTLQVEEAERQVEAIQAWRRDLPEAARNSAPLDSRDLEAHLKTIGSLHISCFHQFSILLVTRPFLVPVLMKRIAVQQQSPLASTDFMNDIDEARASRLAHTCVNVAIHMAQTCWNVFDHGLILGNMCILKAWIFSAALVIGFHLFAITEPDAEAANAFSQSQIILQHLATRSPQAKHYYDILNYLSDAIERRQQQRATPSRKQNAFSIDQIMTMSTGNTTLKNNNALAEDLFDPNLSGFGISGMDPGAWLNNMPADDGQMQQFLENADFGWNSAMMPFWNHFSFDV